MILSGNDDSEVTRGAGYFVQWRAVAVEGRRSFHQSIDARCEVRAVDSEKKDRDSVFFPKKYVPEKEL
jgi:hypothetical protein